MFNKVMTGGACAPSGQEGQLGQNAFTNMVDSMVSGPAQAQQRAEGHVLMQNPQMQQENMQMMQQQFDQMMNEQMMNQEMQKQHMLQNQMQETNLFASRLMQQREQQADLNSLWDQAVQQTDAQQIPSQAQQTQGPIAGNPMMAQAPFQPWMSPMMMQRPMPMYQAPIQTAPMQAQQNATKVEEAKVEEKPEISQVSGNMVEVLSNSTNAVHRNCEFLKFLKQLNHGALTLNEDTQQIVEDKEKMNEFDQLEEQRQKDEAVKQKEEEQFMQEQKEKLHELVKEDDLDQIQDAEDQDEYGDEQDFNRDMMTEEQFEKMMEMWKKEAAAFGGGSEMMDQWGKVWEDEAALGMMGAPQGIKFQTENQYQQEQFKDINLLEKAKQFIEAGQIQEAILCLEAEVQKNKENAEAWRLLGKLFQENDQDDFAIIALRKAHEADPYDLDSLIELGISSTNELEGQEAMKYLTSWLKYHPDFCSLPILEKGDVLQLDDLEQAFIESHNIKKQDTQVIIALGVIQFIRRDFAKATQYFEMAIKENPMDHSVWNKYGAALANSLKTEEAMAAYKQAIDLRPNYVRTLVNIGLAYDNKSQFDDAITSFLNALLLNPKADHIWAYARRSMVQSGKFDLIEKLQLRDPYAFKDIYNLIDPKDLPAQNMENLYNNKIFQE